MTRGAALAWAVCLGVLLSLGGCGIPPDEAPRPVQAPPGPYQALESEAPEGGQAGSSIETLCLTQDESIVSVERRTNGEPAIDALMSDLLAGPTDAEKASGLSSALPGTAVIEGVTVDSGVAVVAIGTVPEGTGRNDERLAFGQMVCTLDARDDVTGVTFANQGEQVPVPRGDGSLSKGPLTTTDYARLLATR